jgi:hypothetical protein
MSTVTSMLFVAAIGYAGVIWIASAEKTIPASSILPARTFTIDTSLMRCRGGVRSEECRRGIPSVCRSRSRFRRPGPANPMIALSGVRSSCDMLARKRSLARLAFSSSTFFS